MTSPIQKIRRGIQQGNWAMVCEGYNGLSGEDLSPPSPEPCDTSWVAESLEEIIRGLKKSGPVKGKVRKTALDLQGEDPDPEEPEEEPEERPAPRKKAQAKAQPKDPPARKAKGSNPDVVENQPLRPTVKPDSGDGRPCRAEPFTLPTQNRFVDDPKKFAAEANHDKKLAKKFSHPGSRPKANMAKATCECGETEEVHPIFLEGAEADKTFKCQKCLKKLKGGRR